MKSSTRNTNPNPDTPRFGPSKLMVAFRFLRALTLVHRTAPNSSNAARSRRIQRAAFASMAYSAGPRRAWSRALLCRLHFHRARRLCAGRSRAAGVSRRPSTTRSPADELRRLVPGGTGMDYCSLLEETADYIRCLNEQVKLMQSVVDSGGPGGR
ncbi:unnamed protein product [Musa acuminata subsp. malaccensis]|uniref:(wild Malaysian banana) hypothetical protein n=1 Tax=Musa acuminata subsp. malaccensis TaxID=214687 RepID=A0A8D7AQR2_MUSAM|nr:unnamed protein product [Musa acuminata subsp. malaccensis]